jgi:hypothetical protein
MTDMSKELSARGLKTNTREVEGGFTATLLEKQIKNLRNLLFNEALNHFSARRAI